MNETKMMMLSLTSTLLLADDDTDDADDADDADNVDDDNDADADNADDERRRSPTEEGKSHVSALAPIESSGSWCAAPPHH
jgi:hypothetical protein